MRTSFAHLALAIAITAIPALAKTDFSGDWKLNTAKSEFGQMPAPNSMTEKITHADPNLTVAVKMSSDMGDMEYEAKYSTDGKETTNERRGNQFKSVAKWDGDALVIETKGSFNGNDFTSKDQWSLSSDGKVLTVKRHMTSAMGEMDQTLVFDKQ